RRPQSARKSSSPPNRQRCSTTSIPETSWWSTAAKGGLPSTSLTSRPCRRGSTSTRWASSGRKTWWKEVRPMSELVIIVEGQTEQAFVQQHLQRYLARRGLMVSAVLPGRRKNHGGVPHWETARDDVIRTLRS